MVEGVEGRLHHSAYIFSVLRAFAVCSAPIVGAGLVGRDGWVLTLGIGGGQVARPTYLLGE